MATKPATHDQLPDQLPQDVREGRRRRFSLLPAYSWDAQANVFGAASLAIIAGSWLIVSPVLLDYQPADPVAVPILLGAATMIAAAARAWELVAAVWPGRLLLVLGGLLMLSGFWPADSLVAASNQWTMGALVFFLAIAIEAGSE